MRNRTSTLALQLELPCLDAETIRQTLEERTGLEIDLALTDNTSTVMSVKSPSVGRRTLRLHYMFLGAPSAIVHALAEWVKSPRRRRADGVLNHFVKANGHLIRERSKRVVVRSRGQHHDLERIAKELNEQFFGGAVDTPITWGKRPARGRRRSIRFGSYTASDHLIRIHPALDQNFVPEYFVRYILFHEMLHAHLGTPKGPSGRRIVHGKAFLSQERAYPDYARAITWQQNPDNLRRLLR